MLHKAARVFVSAALLQRGLCEGLCSNCVPICVPSNAFPPVCLDSLISTAFLATSAVFAAFSGAALLAKRREYLYLGGLCGSAVSMLLATRLASYLFGTYVLQFQLEVREARETRC